MKWTFKSHKGFFIPVINNNEIKGLRIHLDEKYKLDTSDIWFSSSNEYQGTIAKNHMMIFAPKTEKNIKLYNSNGVNKKHIVIASDILMGYRLYDRDKQLTIAVPNKITKEQSNFILQNFCIDTIYMDKHTIMYDYQSIYNNLLDYIPKEKQNVKIVLDYKDLNNDNNNANISEVA